MKPRLWPLVREAGSVLLVLAVGFLLGMKFQHRKMQPELDAYAIAMVQENKRADAWKAKADESEPMIRQWRMGYEQLKKTCGPR